MQPEVAALPVNEGNTFEALFGFLWPRLDAEGRRAVEGFYVAYATCEDDSFPFPQKLGLPGTPKRARRVMRNLSLCRIVDLVREANPVLKGDRLYQEVQRLLELQELRGSYRRRGAPDLVAPRLGDLERELHRFLDLNDGKAVSYKTVSRVYDDMFRR